MSDKASYTKIENELARGFRQRVNSAEDIGYMPFPTKADGMQWSRSWTRSRRKRSAPRPYTSHCASGKACISACSGAM